MSRANGLCTPCLNWNAELPAIRLVPRAQALLAALALLPAPAAAQGLFQMLQQQNAQAQQAASGQLGYAPAQGGVGAALPGPLNLLPIAPGAATARGGRRPKPLPPSPAAFPPEEDDHGDVVLAHETPKLVRVALPPARPGPVERTAEEVAPVGQARWAGGDQLPPGVQIPGLPPAGGSQTIPGAPRLASLPATQSVPRWTLTDEAPLRPPGLRESEAPVADMPGVWAPPEARFDCLPVGLKQVLVDAAKRFGHVAVLNAQRGRGTGARASYHYQCRAVDFRVRGQPVMTVYNFLRDHPNVGGRKIYPMGFFHVDDGPVRSW
jgi:Bacterial protein of unknown function (DUF882)